MYMSSKLLYLYVETPLHAGAGSGLGAIDLPIQRERFTDFPVIHSSGLKGAFRSQTPNTEIKKHTAVFGSEDAETAGAFGVGDGRILLFPVRSVKGLFAWTTCISVLQRWQRERVSSMGAEPITLPRVPAADQCHAGSGVVISTANLQHNSVVLEEMSYTVTSEDVTILASELVKTFPTVMRGNDDIYAYWKDLLPTNLVILPDDDFAFFTMHATEILSRNRIDRDFKIAKDQGLWTEEHLPSESLLFAPVRATPLRTSPKDTPPDWKLKDEQGNGLDHLGQAIAVLDWVKANLKELVQIGGDETVGRGLARIAWSS